MVRKVFITVPAQRRFKSIYDYYKEVAGKKIASQIRKNILSAIKQLKKHPSIGQIETHLEDLKQNHRYIVVGHYKIIYRRIEDRLYVTDIFDSRQDPSKLQS